MEFLSTLNLRSIVDFLYSNWDEILLLGFFAYMSFLDILVCIEDIWGYFIHLFRSIPTTVLLIARLFFGKTWMLLTGYVIGACIWEVLTILSIEKRNDDLSKMLVNGFFTILLCFKLLFG